MERNRAMKYEETSNPPGGDNTGLLPRMLLQASF
jgi:hypothetical protein